MPTGNGGLNLAVPLEHVEHVEHVEHLEHLVRYDPCAWRSQLEPGL
ncbi:MAG TPA: hypothetical protein VFH14_08445 [Gemmatimonadaceae bacterium]|nr:hypothetical protein [Gemmatimonadaceae bacterium]